MWILLTETKRKTLGGWLLLATLLFLLLGLQTLGGTLLPILSEAWLAGLLLVIPGLATCLTAVLLDRQSSLLLPHATHRLLLGLTLAYVGLVVITYLAEPWAMRSSWSMRTYRLQSLWWLLPVQIGLLAVYSLAFFGRRSRWLRKESLTTVAEQEADFWGAQHQQVKRETLALVAAAKLEEALQKMVTNTDSTGIGDLNQLQLLQAQYQRNRQEQHQQLITYEEAKRNENRIAMALMEFLRAY